MPKQFVYGHDRDFVSWGRCGGTPSLSGTVGGDRVHLSTNVCQTDDELMTLHGSWCYKLVISPHGIAMPKGLYFTAVVFSFFLVSFFRRVISAVTERISTKLGHIFTHGCYLKHFVRTPPGIYPHGIGGKKRFWGPTLNSDRTYICNGTWYQQSKRNLSIYRDSPTCSEIWWTLAQKQLRTVNEFLPNP